jgi:H/ACA ribonucleoprotein complex non-core subunit NAF1
MAEPPAKRLKTSLDNGASHLDVPGSPVDDLDDDFYETTPVKPAPLPVDAGDSLFSGADTAPASAGPSSLSIPGLGLPGLGLFSNAVNQGPVTHALSQGGVAPHNEDEELEDGELSDSEVLYNNVHSPKHGTHMEFFSRVSCLQSHTTP